MAYWQRPKNCQYLFVVTFGEEITYQSGHLGALVLARLLMIMKACSLHRAVLHGEGKLEASAGIVLGLRPDE
jgi:hypothetical protein